MVTLLVRFISGTYHATPWGHHVNEGRVEWPPSPWRILRTIIATYYLKCSDHFSESQVKDIVLQLAHVLPEYYLPPVSASHVRYYHPQASYQVFDNFLAVSPDTPLVVRWPEVELTDEEWTVFDEIVKRIGYLGRSESWVDMQLVRQWSGEPNWRPERGVESEAVDLLAPVKPHDYRMWVNGFMSRDRMEKPSGNRRRRRIGVPVVPVVPEDLWQALLMDTNQLEQGGWTRPPGTQWVTYGCGKSQQLAPLLRKPRKHYTMVRLTLEGKPRPRVQQTLTVTELFRSALMRQLDDVMGQIPWTISGHIGTGPAQGHRHAYFLPEDADNDGRIDHLVLYVPSGISDEVIRALGRIRFLKSYASDRVWPVYFEGAGEVEDFSGVSALVGPAATWRSLTPYLHPWHQKKHGKFGPHEQLQRELLLQKAFPAVEQLSRLPAMTLGGHTVYAVEFRKQRPGKNEGPDRVGSFWEVQFSEAILGPLGLGRGAHHGLGTFVALARSE
ncbi:MAG: type I-U CRISPR-associated protein Cas5/Cas6 [Sulfobacillus thermosulfidooxidans]|uniref:Type I-U CRISPR-associated protein Cas5/Cas6 n=1 Tax=Sulfobacillus thermosulfidooxidans TaxID=28034 RepID=A0A2T2WQ56_SULTH|nr:MAG: type I-U CRISPR-associated protein Cas5/Cas6 [Sulfobacillus thermosulfidooxidans]